MLRICEHPGCATYTLGSLCVQHEPPVQLQRFPRGRPYPRIPLALPVEAGKALIRRVERVPVQVVSLEGGT